VSSEFSALRSRLHRARSSRALASAVSCGGLFLCLCGAVAHAGHPLETDDTGTQGDGGVEVEISGVAARPPEILREVEVGLGVAVHTGLAARLDLGASLFWGAASESRGDWVSIAENPSFDLKWRVVDGRHSLPGIAVRVDYAPPHNAIDAHRHDAALLALATWERDRFAASFNIGLVGSYIAAEATVWSGYAAAGGLVTLAEELYAGGEVVAELDGRVVTAARSMGALVWQARADRAISFGLGASWTDAPRPGWLGTVAITSAYGSD